MNDNKARDEKHGRLNVKFKDKKENALGVNMEIKVSDDGEQTLRRKLSILQMKDEWLTHSSVEVQKEILKRNTRKIQNFINSLAVPSWFRGLSIFQKKSAESLLNAIRDDCAIRSVDQTLSCLTSIGLNPLPTKKQLRVVLALCGGSDIALLWFLMEWFYQDIEYDSYNINEQLILSSIAHLDMFITLRELDRILPPGQAPKRQDVKKSENKLPRKCKKNINLMSNSPYFEKLPEPIPRRSNYIGKEKRREAILNYYHTEFKGASELIKNEKNRWFQFYKTNNKDCPIRCMVKEEVSRLMSVFERAIRKNENTSTPALCQHRDEIELLRNLFEEKLQLIFAAKAQEVCMSEHSQKLATRRLDFAIEKFRSEFNELIEDHLKHCNTNEMANVVTEPKRSTTQNSGLQDSSKLSSTDDNLESKFCELCQGQGQLPYKFDYNKIFNIQRKPNDNSKSQTSLTDAVDSDISVLSFIRQMSEAISDIKNQCIKTKCIGLKANEMMELSETKHRKSKVDYGLSYYDPDDDVLMDKMLKDALDIIKEDHKFVLASIPAAHRIPKLREWIRLRYGKRHSGKQLAEAFNQSKSIITALIKVGLPLKLPSNYDMGKNLFTDYSCHNYVLQKSNYIRNEYNKRLNKVLLAQSRIIYFVMHPLLCGYGTSRNTIFAYVPAHERDSYHFRPWKTEENMRNK